MTDATDGEAQNLWNRLRRRKVVQWGIAYAAGAWGLLQGFQFLAQAFDWPAAPLRLATVALGLPIALTLAWYHGDRGHQCATRTEFAILTLLFLLGGGLFWRYYRDIDPALASIRNEPEFKAAFADIERDMDRQRAELGAQR